MRAAAEASHGAEATQLQILVPDGVTKHLPQEARDSLKRAADLHEEERKAEAAAKEAAARQTKEAMELDEFGGLDDQEDPTPDPTAEARIQASIDEILQAQTRGDPERLAVLRAQMARDLSPPAPKKKRRKGSASRRRTAEISIVTINGNFWTTHTEWMAQVGPRHLEAGRCDEEAAKLERQGWRCGFSPAKRNAQKTKTESSLAASALAEQRASGPRGGSQWHGFLSWEESQSSASTSTTPRSGQSATSRYSRRRAEKFGGAQSYGFWRAISTWSLRLLGNTPHPRVCQEFWSSQQRPPSGMERQSDALLPFVVHRAVARQIREVRVLLGNTPHPRVCQEFWSSQQHPPSGMERQSDALITFVVHRAVARQIREVRVLRILAPALITRSR